MLSCLSPALSSPIYSPNGIGLLIPYEYGMVRGMGGAGIANDSGKTFIRENPALLASVKQHTYSFGASYDRNTAYTLGSDNPVFAKTRLELMTLMIPLAKGIVFGWGLSPLSRTDSVIDFTGEDYTDRIEFTGGLNVSTVGIAGSYRDFIRFGLAFNYNFGMIQEKWTRDFIFDDDLFETSDAIKSKYKGYSTTVGVLARVYRNTTVGLGYTGKTNLKLAVHVLPGHYSNPEQLYDKMNYSLPSSWRFGVTTVIKRRVTASMDLSLAQWEDAMKTSREKEMYTNTYRFGAGVRLNPSQEPGASFIAKTPVSVGFKFGTMYYKSYPKVDTVFERAVTLGIELPFQENIASLITSFEIGTRGDKSKNGWDEIYTSIGLLLVGTIK